MESELGGEGQTSDLLRLEASLEGAWRRVVVLCVCGGEVCVSGNDIEKCLLRRGLNTLPQRLVRE